LLIQTHTKLIQLLVMSPYSRYNFKILLCLFIFYLNTGHAQQQSKQHTEILADHCLNIMTNQNVSDRTFTELYSIDSNHAAMVYQYTSNKVNQWLSFGDFLETAIHESNHHLNRILSRECEPLNKRKYFLIGHVFETDLQVSETPSINIINETMPRLLQISSRYDLYISANPNVQRNTLSSLLDELTAYTGEAWIHLQKVERPIGNLSLNYSQFQIDGMVNFMLYLQAYLKSARLYYPDAYAKILSQEKTVAYMAVLWKQAEDILIRSYPNIQNDRAAQRFFYHSDGLASAQNHLKAIYSEDMLGELELLNIPHLSYKDLQSTYFNE